MDQSLYFFELGKLLDTSVMRVLPEISDQWLGRVGYSKRLTQGFGAQFVYENRRHQSLAETGVFFLGRQMDLRANLALDDESNLGFSSNTRMRLGNLSLDFAYRRIWSDSDDDGAILGSSLTQASINANYPVGKGRLNLSARYNGRSGRDTERNVSVRFNFSPKRLGRDILRTDAELTRDRDRYVFLLSIRYRLSRNRWQTELSPQYQMTRASQQGNDAALQTNLTSSWQDEDRYLSDVSLLLGAHTTEQEDSLQADLEVASNRGRMSLETTYEPSASMLNYSAGLSTSFMAARDTITFGGQRLARSALIIDIEGKVDNAHFDVMVDRNQKGRARIGERTIIPLSPYQTYNVQLLSRGEAFVDFNDQIRSVTLYPGNGVPLMWRTKEIIIIFGQIMNAEGKPIVNALIEGVTGLATTDEFGLFQAELDAAVKTLNVRTRQSSCEVRLPDELEIQQSIAILGELTCVSP